jgi:hypothetical protein
MGTMRVRLEEYERPSRLTFVTTGSKMDMRWTFDYSSPTVTKTHVDAHTDIQPKGPMRLMGPLVGTMIKRTFSNRPAARRRDGSHLEVLNQDYIVKI